MKKKNIENVLERLNHLIANINVESSNSPIVVEGKKDLQSLRRLGVNGKIYILSGKSLNQAVDELRKYEGVIILTDFDSEGRKIKLKLTQRLREIGVRVNLTYYGKMKKLSEAKVNTIEGLNSYFSKKRFKNQSSI